MNKNTKGKKKALFKRKINSFCNKTHKCSGYFPVAGRGAATSRGPCHGGGSFEEHQLRSPRVGGCKDLPARCRGRAGLGWRGDEAPGHRGFSCRSRGHGKLGVVLTAAMVTSPFVSTSADERSHRVRVARGVHVNGRYPAPAPSSASLCARIPNLKR